MAPNDSQRISCPGPVPTYRRWQIYAFIETRLPAYMVPAVFFKVAAWPLTATGKVDRRRLADLLRGARGSGRLRRSTQRGRSRDAGLWARHLGLPLSEIGIPHGLLPRGTVLIAAAIVTEVNDRHHVTCPSIPSSPHPRWQD